MIVNRYIQRSIHLGTLGALLLLVSLSLFFTFVRELDNLGENGYGILQLLEYLALRAPGNIIEFLPLSVLLGSMLGEVWVRLTQRQGNRLVLLGAGIMTGALFTNWSPLTNGLFVLGGLLTAAWGVSMNFAPPREKNPPADAARRGRSPGKVPNRTPASGGVDLT